MRVGGSEEAHDRASDVSPVSDRRGSVRQRLARGDPTLVHRRLSSLPRYLGAEDVERVIASCDVAAEAGLRDRAILLLLARLGLRAGDIVQLRLRDIDWQSGLDSRHGQGPT